MNRFLFLGLVITLCCNFTMAEEAISSDVNELRPKSEVEISEKPEADVEETYSVELKENIKKNEEENVKTEVEESLKVELKEIGTAKSTNIENNIVPLKLDVETPVIHDVNEEEKKHVNDVKTYVVPERFDSIPIKKDNTPTLKPLVLNTDDGNIREDVPVGVEHKNLLETSTDPNGYTDITAEEKAVVKAQETENNEVDKHVNFNKTDSLQSTVKEKDEDVIYLDLSSIKKNADSLNNLKQPPVKLIKDNKTEQIQNPQLIPNSIKVF